jgi:hypothetical protein
MIIGRVLFPPINIKAFPIDNNCKKFNYKEIGP